MEVPGCAELLLEKCRHDAGQSGNHRGHRRQLNGDEAAHSAVETVEPPFHSVFESDESRVDGLKTPVDRVEASIHPRLEMSDGLPELCQAPRVLVHLRFEK